MIIAFSGKRGVGKSFSANYLSKFYGFEKMGFADEIRRMAKTMFPFTDADLSDPKKKEAKWGKYDWSPREFMLHLGELMRFHDEDYWVDKLQSRIKKSKNVVIDDLRFDNEFQALKKQGVVLVRVERFEKLNPYGKNLDIPSETSLDSHKFDHTIDACWNTTTRELESSLDKLMDKLEG